MLRKPSLLLLSMLISGLVVSLLDSSALQAAEQSTKLESRTPPSITAFKTPDYEAEFWPALNGRGSVLFYYYAQPGPKPRTLYVEVDRDRFALQLPGVTGPHRTGRQAASGILTKLGWGIHRVSFSFPGKEKEFTNAMVPFAGFIYAEYFDEEVDLEVQVFGYAAQGAPALPSSFDVRVGDWDTTARAFMDRDRVTAWATFAMPKATYCRLATSQDGQWVPINIKVGLAQPLTTEVLFYPQDC